jgi:hypothetical protein
MVTASAQIHLEAVANLGRHQQHVVSRLQLAELGIRSDVVRDQVSAVAGRSTPIGSWCRPARDHDPAPV